MLSYATKLRRFADWLDLHPTVAKELEGSYDYPSVHVYVYSESDETTDWEQFQEVVRTLGSFEKDGYGGQLTARHTEYRDPEAKEERLFEVTIATSGACERVEKTDETGKPIMQKKRVYQETDEMEPVYEWKCPESWLS